MNAPQRIPPLAPFEESPLRKQLVERLENAAPGDVVTYYELGELIGCNVQGECRHLLASAQRVLLRRRVVFGAVINIGVKRLTDIGIVDRVADGTTRAHRAVRRAGKILTIAEYEKLPPADQARYRVEQLRIGAIAQFGGKAGEVRLIRAVHEEVTPKQLKAAIVQSLEQFNV